MVAGISRAETGLKWRGLASAFLFRHSCGIVWIAILVGLWPDTALTVLYYRQSPFFFFLGGCMSVHAQPLPCCNSTSGRGQQKKLPTVEIVAIPAFGSVS